MKCLVIEESFTFKSLFRSFFSNLKIEAIVVGEDGDLDSLIFLEIYDLILVSSNSDSSTALQVVARIRENQINKGHKEIPILFISQNLTLEKREEAFQTGVTNFLQKPFRYEEFLATIESFRPDKDWISGSKILVVDDSEPTRKLVKLYLTKEGFKVTECNSGQEALSLLLLNPGTFDLIITDQNMPEMTGDEFCFKARSLLGLKNIPILFLSGDSEKKDIKKIYDSGASDYILKPFDRLDFISRVIPHLRVSKYKTMLSEKERYLQRLMYFKEEVFQILSNDLDTPMEYILGQIIKSNALENKNEIMIKMLSEMEKSIKDLYNLSSLYLSDNQRIESFSIEYLLQNVLKSQENLLRIKRIKIQLKNELKTVMVKGNWKFLYRVMLEIFTNAIKYSNMDSIISINVEQVENQLHISFEDYGVGIDPISLEHIFLIQKGKSLPGTLSETGSGQGLYIANKLVEKMDGKITITSKIGEGTKVDIYIPLLS